MARRGTQSAQGNLMGGNVNNQNDYLQKILAEVDPKFVLQPGVEELLMDMATDFVHDVTSASGRLAKHRRATQVDAKDMQLVLDKSYGISVAAKKKLHAPSNKPKPAKTSVHMHRVALKRKILTAVHAQKKKANKT
ncbi:hypothetical protein H257_12117 [Aphanomyces astaci]|uniref:Transcription initiation factor TFIID subunit 12 domain-containing protein n=2 Tax=Aphanomyces astaci TaxID=112090 RepID=W4G1D7_APHAT|nr:hypothetical protein H257_12117 [Aphanomyces astaci]ETV72743.1 hypothetical protein H257_12117 [Aphanomyces astaci]RHY11495.1 hypothetical protein DYB36_008583 [Aphanomyces astaci]RHY18894.1 hypothetical protein DYB25_007633 [Aphanomyces astaci]RHY36339.1 hypothetical protein DYB34_003087 [Aphanomyces astaci]RHY53527.1 hypothetical protein DYB30_002113 [Aphanomyces astaci]|eukprot:XP_009837529.1 hypothetical protein H257_12117 [Aphanomyces astaci]